MRKYSPYKPLYDYFLFSMDRRFNNETESGIIVINEAYISGGENEESEGQIDHRRIYGNVIQVPTAFSDEKVTAIDPGIPSPKRYIGHDEISEKIRMGLRGYSKADYSPASYQGPEYIRLHDIGKLTNIQVGDKIYVDYKAVDYDQYLGVDEHGKHIFRVRVDEILCSIRDGVMIAQGGWVIIQPNKESWEDITSEEGIIMKVAPENIPLEGYVLACDHSPNTISIGDKIVFMADADWEVEIEGEKVFPIQYRDLLGKLM